MIIQNGDSAPEKNTQGVLSAEDMQNICRKVVGIMEAEKLFMKPDFSAWELSRAAGVNTKNISKSINGYMSMNFYELLTRMRLEEAKRLMRHEVKMNIEEVAHKSGFRSRTTFYTRFVQHEKMTPKKYMNLFMKSKTNL